MSTKFSRKTFLKGSVAGLGMMALMHRQLVRKTAHI